MGKRLEYYGENKMSGCSDEMECPKCGRIMQIYTNWKRPAEDGGECLECGYAYYIVEEIMSLKEVNELRIDQELKPLKKLFKKVYNPGSPEARINGCICPVLDNEFGDIEKTGGMFITTQDCSLHGWEITKEKKGVKKKDSMDMKNFIGGQV